MQLPSLLQGDSLTRLLQGAFARFCAAIVMGFGWGGWTLGGTAKQMADKNASAAVVAILAPMCADKFRQGADASANMAELKKVSSWMQDSYIEKGGWATFPGNGSPDRSVPQVGLDQNEPAETRPGNNSERRVASLPIGDNGPAADGASRS